MWAIAVLACLFSGTIWLSEHPFVVGFALLGLLTVFGALLTRVRRAFTLCDAYHCSAARKTDQNTGAQPANKLCRVVKVEICSLEHKPNTAL